MDILIKDIGIDNVNIPEIQVYQPPGWTTNPSAIFAAPPITQEVGVPIVNMPGCVEAHEQNTTSERSGVLSEDDPKGVKTFCDAGTPSFNPMDYNRDELEITGERPVPEFKGSQPKNETQPDPPSKDIPKETIPKIECPTQKQLSEEPIGFIFDSGRKEVTGYKLVGNQCIREVRDVPIIEQAINGLPPTGTVITTGGIAVVATTSALLAKPFADILLKVIKPTVKKVLKKVAAIRGKQMKILSVKERQAEQRDRNQAIAKLRAVKAKTKK